MTVHEKQEMLLGREIVIILHCKDVVACGYSCITNASRVFTSSEKGKCLYLSQQESTTQKLCE